MAQSAAAAPSAEAPVITGESRIEAANDRWIGATKNPDTRQRRVEVAISKLHDGKRRPCCFDLSSFTDPDVAKSGKLAVGS